MDQLLQHHLNRVKHRMKRQADQNKSEHSFSVSDLVYMKLQPYVQTSLVPRSHQKLAFRFFGPYRIIARIGSVAYKLELLAHSAIHLVFHISQLKKVVGASHQVISSLPTDFAMHLAPEQILQTRSVARGASKVTQVLVKWNNLSKDLVTWEDYEALRQEFPRATARGQAASQGGSVSRCPSSSHEDNGSSEAQPREQRNRRANPRIYVEGWA
jgi:hypothetical protein